MIQAFPLSPGFSNMTTSTPGELNLSLLMDEDVVVEGDGYEGKISSLQPELQDLQERYFDMSLNMPKLKLNSRNLYCS
ncbi:hypothetical protein Peur_054090 [Populus x canadensis]